jgi:class 3 adenylate cyclase/tetratricopeptide (TPR) repeat protein
VRCPRCQQENPPQSSFCLECGGRLAGACPACGTDLPPGAKFCNRCGAPTAPAPGSATSIAPESYTPRHLAEKILASRQALEGERKQVTVLFADLKGSLELLADRDPEEARALLDPVLERLMDAVHRYEGTVNQVMGDGIMALFGAPVAHEDHAIRACYAALDMQAAIRRYADEVRRAHGVRVQIRVGLNSGGVVVRAIGSDLRTDYTAVGQTTHLAARMEQLADPGATLLTAQTLALAEGFVEVRSLGPVPVKGLDGPVETYELVGAGPRRSRLHAAATRGLTRFVGRDRELEQLREALARAAAGRGQVVAVVGEPGVGKSRLVWEVIHSHRTHGWLIRQAGSVSYGKATPYLPVVQLLHAYFEIEDRDDGRRIREKLTGKLLALDRALEPALPALLALLDVPGEDPAWQALDAPQRRQRTLDAVRRLLLRESQVQPLLVVFEDLHWIDSETQAFLDGLVDSLASARLLLLVNYRPEYQQRWGGKSYYAQLRLDPLAPESAEALLQSLLGGNATLPPLKRLLLERTGGNPFFLEESVRTLVETHVLIGERGAYGLVKSLRDVGVPATVQAVIAARIDRLPGEDKRLLQEASVIGKDVPYALLEAVTGMPEAALRAALDRLQAAEFVYETGLFAGLDYTFKHALTHEVAYGSLLQERRRALHVRILETIETIHAERLAEHVDRLAGHAFRGEAWEKAVAYLRQAGARAMARSAYPEAAACFEQALDGLKRLPETRETLEQSIDIRFELRYALSPLGEQARALAYLQEARVLAEALGDQRRVGWALTNMTTPLNIKGDNLTAADLGERALAIARGLDDFPLRIEAQFYLAVVDVTLGRLHEAVDLLQDAVNIIAGDWMRYGTPAISSVMTRAYLGVSLAALGRFEEAAAHADDGVRLAEEADHSYSRTGAYFGAGSVYLNRGDLERAVPLLSRGLELCRTWNFGIYLPALACSLSLACAASGRVGDALRLADELTHGGGGPWVDRPFVLVRVAEAYLLAGRTADALSLAGRALELARARHEAITEASGLRLLGEIAVATDPSGVERASLAYRQALDLAGRLGLRPLVAHCHLGLGRLAARAGDPATAREHLDTATRMYRVMGMAAGLARAEAAIAML